MLYILISMFFLIIALILANDFMFNKRRNKFLKILEFFAIAGLVYLIFLSALNYLNFKDNIKSNIKNSRLFGSPITVYSIDGETKMTMSIGDFLYGNFVRDAFNGKTNITEEEYNKNNFYVIIMTVILFSYWIILLIFYEKEDKINYKIVEDEILFEKYNPLMAACIAQNRNVMWRDVIGVVLNLINKGKIKIRHIPDKKVKKIGYRYMISENEESNVRLDMIETYIYDWIFEEIPNYKIGKINVDYIKNSKEYGIEIDLIKRLKSITNEEDTYARIKELNYNTKKRLNFIGANQESVPFLVKAFNTVIIFLNMFVVANHIINNGLDITLTNLEVLIYMFVMMFVITILPIIYVISLVCFKFIKILFKTLQQVTEGYSGRRLIAKAVSIIIATFMLIIIYAAIGKDFYIIYDILLLGVTSLIIYTDDYMLKHEHKILNDYYNLRRIEDKIRNYSMMKKENIEYVEIWGKYYAYAVAFGIAKPVEKEIDAIYENTQILDKESFEGIYYVCKSYLEVMWDMEFYEKKSFIDINKIIDKNI